MLNSYEYVTFNVNNGDSAGYYVRKDEPTIVRNFKGEENFMFEVADPATYQWFTQEYLPAQETAEKKSTGDTNPQKVVPFAYVSRGDDVVKYGYYDPKNNELSEMYPTTLGSKILETWFERKGTMMPEKIPFALETFDPTDPRTVDIENEFVNTFRPPAVFWSKKRIPEEAAGAEMNTVYKMKLVAPTIYDLLQHMTCGGEEFPRFVNWLAAVFQKREKMRTAWVIHGVQGTGKGSLTDKVLKPIFGEAARTLNVKTLSEHFNAWLGESVIVTVEEFKNSNADNASELNNRIKEYITESNVAVRSMRQNLQHIKNYANFIFFSNEYDAVYIEDTDRRFNVCPRQEIPILQRYPDWKKRIEKDAPKELEGFVRFMMEFKVDMDAATTALHNAAKHAMQESSRRTQDSFVNAVRTGDLDYFAEVLEMPMQLQGGEELNASKNTLKVFIRDHIEGEPTAITNSELRSLYGALVGRTGSPKKFGKMINRLGLQTKKVYRNGIKTRGMEVTWKLNEIDRQRLIQQYKIDVAVVNQHVNNMEQFVPRSEKPQEQS